jgi:endo-1,4-beta-xylanase
VSRRTRPPMTHRRDFLKKAVLTAAGLAVAPSALAAPTVLTPRRTRLNTAAGTLRFRPHYVQEGRGPYFLDWAYASDEKWDAFHSNVTATVADGVAISDTEGQARFGVDVKWYVEGMGNLFMTADNGGEFYTLPPDGQERELNLNHELAKSRVMRNRRRVEAFTRDGYAPSREVQGHLDMAEGYFEDAARVSGDEARRGGLAQSALLYALRGGELLEVDRANQVIARRGPRPFWFGCDARAFYQMNTPELFMERFTGVFDFAALTYVWEHRGVIGDFERTEGAYNYEFRDPIVRRMRANDVTVEGRPLFWFHHWVTPEWVEAKTFDELKRYVERHVRNVVGHYGDEIWAWEVVNEFHDWANDVELDPDQTVELTKLACDVAADVRPNVGRLINNCCPYAEYVGLGQWSGWPNQPARHPQRTPWEFTRDLVDAGVDFTHIGQQMYFPERDLQDIILMTERFEVFQKPLHLSEVGAPGGPTTESVRLGGRAEIPTSAYDWHGPWDEDTQADWIEGVYTLAYSKAWIEGAHWFDFADVTAFMPNGGLMRSTERGEPKEGYRRLQALQRRWGVGPAKDTPPPPVPGSATGVGSTGSSTCETC